MFGEIKDRRAVSWLEEVLDGEYDEEVKEAAREAIEKMPTMPKIMDANHFIKSSQSRILVIDTKTRFPVTQQKIRVASNGIGKGDYL
jgi:hypothetical protein